MWKIYFKQTIALLKQNKIISIVSITGTALAIIMVMVVLLVEHINVTEMAPEVNRDSMMYIKMHVVQDTINKNMNTSFIPTELCKNYLMDLPSAKTISLITPKKIVSNSYFYAQITVTGSQDVHLAKQMSTDANYWQLMVFNFVAGTPYTEADCDARLNKVVIIESKAKEIFGSAEEAMNKTINLDFIPFQIVGVVKDVSPIFTFCDATVFTSDIYHRGLPYCVLILANSSKDFDKIREEVRNAERAYEVEHPHKILEFIGPYDHKYQRYDNSGEFVDEKLVDRKLYFILLVLLIIPAINLSSFSFSQIKKRIEEIGIRKSFGATRWNIVKQMLIENFITTLIGGVIGLLASYFILFWLRTWLLNIPYGGAIPPQILFSPSVFLIVFVVCFILNTLSAGLPAIITIKMKIVDALNRK